MAIDHSPWGRTTGWTPPACIRPQVRWLRWIFLYLLPKRSEKWAFDSSHDWPPTAAELRREDSIVAFTRPRRPKGE